MNYVKTAFICTIMAASAPALAPVFATTTDPVAIVDNHKDASIDHGAGAKQASPIGLIGGIKAVKKTDFSTGNMVPEVDKISPSKSKPDKQSITNKRSEYPTLSGDNSQRIEPTTDDKGMERPSPEAIAMNRDLPIADRLALQVDDHNSKRDHPTGQTKLNSLKKAVAMRAHTQPTIPEETSDTVQYSHRSISSFANKHSQNPNVSVPEIDGSQSGLVFGLLISLLAVFRERRIKK